MKILVFNGSMGVKRSLEMIIESSKENGVDKILCLGDLIGIGNDNIECLEIAKTNEIQLVSGIFEGLLTGQLDSSEIDESIVSKIMSLRPKLAKEDIFWLSDLKRLTILENLLFMYGNYIDRYALFQRESDFKETDLITRKKHPILEGIIIGSANGQNFYNGKRLIQVRTKREYDYSEIKNSKFMASPGRAFSVLRTNSVKSTWIIIDTEEKKVNYIIKKSDTNEEIEEINNYDIESVFSPY